MQKSIFIHSDAKWLRRGHHIRVMSKIDIYTQKEDQNLYLIRILI